MKGENMEMGWKKRRTRETKVRKKSAREKERERESVIRK